MKKLIVLLIVGWIGIAQAQETVEEYVTWYAGDKVINRFSNYNAAAEYFNRIRKWEETFGKDRMDIYLWKAQRLVNPQEESAFPLELSQKKIDPYKEWAKPDSVKWQLTSCTTEECKEKRLAEGWEPFQVESLGRALDWQKLKVNEIDIYRYWFRRVK